MGKLPTTLSLPPFPLLTWNGHSWNGRIVLESWRGFQSRLGSYGSRSSDDPSSGEFIISVEPAAPPPTETSRKQPPSAIQAKSFTDWLEHETAHRDAMIQAIADEYPSIIKVYRKAGLTDLPEVLSGPAQLRGLIGLSVVHVLAEATDGICFIGCEFGCEWDEEHGLGVMTHRGEVIQIGGADAAFCI